MMLKEKEELWLACQQSRDKIFYESVWIDKIHPMEIIIRDDTPN